LARTPWAEEEIAKHFKFHLIKNLPTMKIGESWEFSCDQSFPSQVASEAITLSELIKQYPNEILSEHAMKKNNGISCEILVKIINANSPLSMQVHPHDDNEYLKDDECGKPESWYVIDHKPGAGIYLGFNRSTSKEELHKAILSQTLDSDLFQFVPVEKGDYFEINPGTPHAIGPGVTLLEPQWVQFNKKGKTYRLWDWARKYSEEGNLDPINGTHRELHINEALQLIDPESQVGESFVNNIRKQGVKQSLQGAQITSFPHNQFYQLVIVDIHAQGKVALEIENGYGVCTQLAGQANFRTEPHNVAMVTGETSLIPHCALPLHIESIKGCQFALIIPSTSDISFHSPS